MSKDPYRREDWKRKVTIGLKVVNLKQRALPDLQRFKKKIVDKLKGKKCSETLRKAITQL
jgi:hypothetical protein